ncbi:tetratricopeptide repeat protein [Streptomyces sp. NPDC006997]|uniref:tetratricopeptide repeat protein n=1 Tax=Streptomyces sp. NPDC006997 TaxID=3155356 RepID=UPI0033E6E7DC
MGAFPYSGLEVLLSAMVAHRAHQESSAWQELARVVAVAARADAAVARLRLPGPDPGQPQEQGPEAARWQELARTLTAIAARDAATASALTEWLRRHAPPGPPGPAASSEAAATTANTISGAAVLHGPTVQAGTVHGGVHFHPPPTTPAPRTPVPRQLPPVTARFLDREADRQALDAWRAGHSGHAPQVLVVSGLAGAGKTAFASHWLHGHASGFPDGQLYADLSGQTVDGGEGGPASPSTVLEAFLTALGAPSVPAGIAQRTALWRSMTSELRLAVLLDSAVTAAQVRPLLPASPTSLTVVTSRNNLTGLRVDGACLHRLEGLPTEFAVELLALGGGTRVALEPAAAHEVVRLCGRLPLTVGLASAQLAVRPHRSLAALAESLSQGQGAIGQLHVDGEAVMRTALDMSYALLPEESARLYRRMGLLPTDRYDLMTLAAVAAADGEGAPTADVVDTAVHALVEANLLEETGPDTYRFHDLVQPHARRLGEEGEDREQRERTLRRYVDWCLATAASAERILTPSHPLPGHDLPAGTVAPTALTGPEEALAWLDTHRNGLMGAVRLCARAGWHTSCWRLTDLMWPLVQRFHVSEIAIESHRLGLEAARRSGSRPGEGRMLTSGALSLRAAGRYEEAADWYRQALALALADGDTRQQAQAVNGLGHLSLLTGRLDEARDRFEEALRLRESIGYRRGAALSRLRLGETALASGDLTAAAARLHRAGDELAALGETYEATRALALLGHVLDRAGDRTEGVRRLREALARFRAGGTRAQFWEARCLEWLGMAAEADGDRERSAHHYTAARDLFRRLSPADADRLDDRLRQL